jgi:hypothetical protein
MEVQTDDYLEDVDDAVFEQEMGTQVTPLRHYRNTTVTLGLHGCNISVTPLCSHCDTSQTDFIEELPPVEAYENPFKSRGEDKTTEITGAELFDFDDAVAPILETLMGKAIDYGQHIIKRWSFSHNYHHQHHQHSIITPSLSHHHYHTITICQFFLLFLSSHGLFS